MHARVGAVIRVVRVHATMKPDKQVGSIRPRLLSPPRDGRNALPQLCVGMLGTPKGASQRRVDEASKWPLAQARLQLELPLCGATHEQAAGWLHSGLSVVSSLVRMALRTQCAMSGGVI